MIDEIEHYSIKKYEAFGISQEEFIQSFLPNFRYSFYITKKSYAEKNKDFYGRPKISIELFETNPNLANQIKVVDRVGYLGQSFKSLHQSAISQQSSSIAFAHYSTSQYTLMSFALNFIVHPMIASSLRYLSNNPTIHDLYQENKNFYRDNKLQFDDNFTMKQLIELLNLFEKINFLTYSSNVGPINNQSYTTSTSIEEAPTLVKQGIIYSL